MGTLERLQNSIFEFLRGINDLRFADIKKDTLRDLNGKAEGLRINIVSPLPKSASKYAAGPTFSEVEIAVEISRRRQCRRARSLSAHIGRNGFPRASQLDASRKLRIRENKPCRPKSVGEKQTR